MVRSRKTSEAKKKPRILPKDRQKIISPADSDTLVIQEEVIFDELSPTAERGRLLHKSIEAPKKETGNLEPI